jgi:hypothetical protein
VDDDPTCLLFHTIGAIIIHTARKRKNLANMVVSI